MVSNSIPERFREYLAGKLGFEDVVVHHAELLFGGYSRESWRIDASWLTANGVRTERSMILRLDPPSSLLESNRRIEFAMYKAFWSVPGVPVPEPLFIEDDPGPLGMPFFVMSRLDGVAWPGELRNPIYKDKWSGIARQMFEILGLIAAQDYRDLGLDDVLAAPSVDEAWAMQLDYWEKIIHDHDIGPLPVISAVIRKLRREPPPAAQKVSVVHGDYRIGNYLYSPKGIIGILDWELAHLGDPIEDLAWSFARNWHFEAAPGKVAGKLMPDEAIRIWEGVSGLKVDRNALRWWTLFTHVKAYAMWVSAANKAATDSTRQLVNSDIAWKNMYAQELWMLEDMGGAK
jgi:aminoglycoside phosphotransferase (APT) family kinase protein